MKLFMAFLLAGGISWAAPVPKVRSLASRLICKISADKKSPELYFG